MDSLIKRFEAVLDGDLQICEKQGLAYQADMTRDRMKYGDKYYQHYRELEGSEIAKKLNNARCEMLARHAPAGCRVWDFGSGSGEFVGRASSKGFRVYGYDINPRTVEKLKSIGAYAPDMTGSDVVTFWDSLEHVENPHDILERIGKGKTVLVAVPLVDIHNIRSSRHYKPGEHLYYFNRNGFVSWMALYGYRLLEESDHEVASGRESIGAFAFRRDLPDYDDYIKLYAQMHFERYYGASATELYLETAHKVVSMVEPGSILDFGCGRSDLVAHFWLDGRRRIERYDPAIRAFRHLPEGHFDLVFCCDVMEHIPMMSIDRVFANIRSKGSKVLFTISTKLARAKLPDGSNAHCTLLTANEWRKWVGEIFGPIIEMPTHSDQELILLVGHTTP